MKKVLVTIAGVLCATAICVHADDANSSSSSSSTGKKHGHKMTAEQKELLEKYDTNKDGKLDKEEKSKMTAEDKEKWGKSFSGKKKKDASSQ
jgi:hypothetical protein